MRRQFFDTFSGTHTVDSPACLPAADDLSLTVALINQAFERCDHPHDAGATRAGGGIVDTPIERELGMVTDVRYTLPVGGSGSGDSRLTFDGDLLLEFGCSEDQRGSAGAIKFYDVIAFRFRDEMHSLGFVESSYDSIVEVPDSDWYRELLRIEPHSSLRTIKDKHHYACFLSDSGYLEIIASRFEARP